MLIGVIRVIAQNCTVIVPNDPLTAVGLSTPYQYIGCDETNAGQASFVEALILNKKTGNLVAYSPLIVNQGTQPLLPVVVPNVTTDHVVGIWFGSNANFLRLQGANKNTLKNARCINGRQDVPGDLFGQVAGCGTVRFFEEANRLFQNGILIIPPLGTGLNGLPCPTIRSFTVVDQDQSDNVVTSYLTDGTSTAQNSPVNLATFAANNVVVTELDNGSDNRLLEQFIDGSLGCNAMQVLDVSSGQLRSTQGTNELQAAAFQQPPIALIPPNDEMVLFNGNFDRCKVDSYRKIVNQPRIREEEFNGLLLATKYCANLVNVGVQSLANNKQFYIVSKSPNIGQNLFDFLGNRMITSFEVLKCLTLLNIVSPLVANGNGNITILTTTTTSTTTTNLLSITQPTNTSSTTTTTTTTNLLGITQPTNTSSTSTTTTTTNLLGITQPTNTSSTSTTTSSTTSNLLSITQPPFTTPSTTVQVFPVQFSFQLPYNPVQNCLCNCV